MKLSKQTRREAKQLFRNVLSNGVVDEARTRQTVKALIEQKPRGYLAILTHFQRLIKLELEKRSARVESPVQLSREVQQQIESSLGRKYGAGLKIDYQQNSSLLGGLRIRVGSDVYDGSVQARLTELEESF